MPSETFSKPLESMLNGKCAYEYYYHTSGTYALTPKTRICHVSLDAEDDYNKNIILMVFTIRNQSGKWKIHSEGIKRTDPGSTVPLRNKAISLAYTNGWKYASIAVAGEDTPSSEVVYQYVVSMESYNYGSETVYDLTDDLAKLEELGLPDFYRRKAEVNGNTYSFAFIKKHKLVDYLSVVDNRSFRDHIDILLEADPIESDLTIDELGDILARMYNSASEGNQSNAIRMFGVKYGGIIVEKGYAATAITKASGIDSSAYSSEVSKGISIYKSIKENVYGFCFYDPERSTQTECFSYDLNAGAGENRIFYGTPGCGKSYYIEHDILGKTKDTGEYKGKYTKKNIIRTTFYQDYSNTDFVGQILPKVIKGQNGTPDSVEYIFNPGPFTLALIQAISNPKKQVALVIEEINRGNAPAIFGDVFQLLDRDENGISEYGIVNVSLMDYLNDYEFVVDGQKKRYNFKEIKIPGNMNIFATMNTSDQNVYTLDTAFVRRWEKEKIKNDFSKCTFRETPVPGMEYTWEEFADAINSWIANNLDNLQVNEDKQLGAFFVKESLLLSKDAKKFAYKVFDYLWNDVTKLDHGMLFDSKISTLDQLVDEYTKSSVKVFSNPGMFQKKPTAPAPSEDNHE